MAQWQRDCSTLCAQLRLNKTWLQHCCCSAFPMQAPFPGQCQGWVSLLCPWCPLQLSLTAVMPTVTLRQPQMMPVAEMMLCSRVTSCRLIRRMHRHSWGRQTLHGIILGKKKYLPQTPCNSNLGVKAELFLKQGQRSFPV